MSWVRIDDGVPTHPKILKAGPMASWLWVCGICYCTKHLTDGFIPNAALATIGQVPNIRRVARKLIAAGLWLAEAEGYRVHDYHDYNDTREQALSRQQATYEQRRRAGIASGASRRSGEKSENTQQILDITNGAVDISLNEQRTGRSASVQQDGNGADGLPLNPIPSHPIPSQELQVKQELAQKHHASADADFERFRLAYPASRRVGGKTGKSAFKTATHGRNGTHFTAILDALDQQKRSEQWQTPKLIPLMTTWLNQERWNQVLPEKPSTSPQSSSWCQHDPPCRSEQNHRKKLSAERGERP